MDGGAYRGGNVEFVRVDGIRDDAPDGGPGPAVHHREDLVARLSHQQQSQGKCLVQILCLRSSPGSVSM